MTRMSDRQERRREVAEAGLAVNARQRKLLEVIAIRIQSAARAQPSLLNPALTDLAEIEQLSRDAQEFFNQLIETEER